MEIDSITNVDNKIYICYKCRQIFYQLENLKNHNRKCNIETTQKKYKIVKYCLLCQKSYTSPYGLRKHIKAIHQGIKNFYCVICSKTFSDKSNIMRHIKFDHFKWFDYKCCCCNRLFKTASLFRNHIEKVHKIYTFLN